MTSSDLQSLRDENQALRKTVDALIKRAEQKAMQQGSGFDVFEQNLALQNALHQKTQELAESRELMRQAMIGASDGFWSIDLVKQTTWHSERLIELVGADPSFSASDATSVEDAFAMLHPEDREPTWQAMQDHLNHNVPYDVTFRYRMGDGTYRWFRGRGQAKRDEHGRPTVMAGSMQDIHEQRVAEEALKQAITENRLLAVVAEQTDRCVVIHDREGRVAWINKAFTELTGWSLEELKGRLPGEVLCGPVTDPNTRREVFESVRDVKPLDTEIEIYNKAGGTFWFYMEVRPRYDDQGEHVGFIAMARDTTDERKKRKRLSMLEAAVHNATEPMFTVLKDGRFIDVNQTACERLKYTYDELTSMRVLDIDPKITEEGWQGFWNKLKSEKNIRFPAVQQAKDGTKFPVSISAYFLCHDSEEYCSAFARDMSQEIEMENRLRAERKLLSDILEQIPYLIFWTDRDSRIQGCNTAFMHAVGASSLEQVIGSLPHDLNCTPEHAELCLANDQQVMTTGKPLMHQEQTVTTNQGHSTTLEVNKVPLRNQQGEIMGVIAILADVTQRRQLEAQLAQAQKLESIGQLAAGIAHEINTPTQYVSDNTMFLHKELTHIFDLVESCSSLMHNAAPPENWEQTTAQFRTQYDALDYDFLCDEIPEALQESLEGLDRISRIVKAMKEFSHPGTLAKDATDINRAIDSTATVCHNRWKYAAQLHLDLDPTMPDVPCLLAEFNQVILNLIVNAADAIEDRYGLDPEVGRITIRTSYDDQYAVIRVIDNGCGMPDEIKARVFDPFFTTKQVGRGTGQGLAISRDVIVNKLGGTLHCESQAGQQTTFTIRIPRHHALPNSEAA